MADKIRVKRGNKANLPTLDDGEFGLSEDTKQVFVGSTLGNLQIAMARPTAETWIAPTLLNSWVNLGGGENSVGYFKDDFGVVRIRGMITSGTITSGTVLFNLPAGYRPSSNMRYPVNNNLTTGYLIVTGAGGVKIDGNVTSSASLCLDTIIFRAEQ